MNEELRMYSLCNFYLSSIQQGIQSGHCVDNMSVYYILHSLGTKRSQEIFIDWIANHKTIIILNGGDNQSIREADVVFSNAGFDLDLPFGYFEEIGLGNIMTCCNIVLPESLYNAKKFADHKEFEEYFYEGPSGVKIYEVNSPEWEIINLIKSKSLAK